MTMNNTSTIILPLSPTPEQSAVLTRLSRVTEGVQLRAQQTTTSTISLAARIEQGELNIEQAAARFREMQAPPALVQAALEDLLHRRAGAARAVSDGMPLPPVQRVAGTGLLTAVGVTGLRVLGCRGLVPVRGGWPDQIDQILRTGGTIALDTSWVIQQTFGGQDWMIHVSASCSDV